MATSSDRSSHDDQPDRPRLGFLLRQAAAAHRVKVDQALADLKVTAPQFLVLRLLAEHIGASNADVARMTGLTTPTVSVIVANLKRRDALVSRPHAVHRRVQHLDLTNEGDRLLAACKARITRVEADLQTGITPAKLAVVHEWLRAVSAMK